MSRALPEGFKVLHVLDHSVPLHSGYAFRTLAILREQRRRGWQTAHVTSPKHTLESSVNEEVEGLSFYRTQPISGLGRKTPGIAETRLILKTARRIEEVAAFEKPHLLHAHSPVLNALACLVAARKLRLPIVYEVRAFWEDAAVSSGTTREGSVRYHLTKAIETYALQASDAVTAICQGLKADMQKRGIEGEKVTLIPNGVDVGEFALLKRAQRSTKAVELGNALRLHGQTVLGFLGSFYPYEGLELLIAAIPAVLREQPDVRLVLGGGGPAESELKAQAKSLGLEDVVTFLGRVPQREIIPYYELIDVLVFPRHSMRLTELVTPLKPLEAMATGGIVLASSVGGHRELIHHTETGYLFPASDQAGLEKALIEVIANRPAWEAMRARARGFVEGERNWAVCTSGYENAYLLALAAHCPRND
jgi:PEP-CTERM/exosortase A-associated glycosyltransferase